MGEGEPAGGQAAPSADQEGNCPAELADSKQYLAYYKKVLSRYSEDIAAGEQKTVPELKAMVNPKDPAVLTLHQGILEGLGLSPDGDEQARERFDCERDLGAFSQAALARVRELKTIKADLGVPFWLSPSDVMELGAADSFDRALLLCALLNCAGCTQAKVLVLEVEGSGVHPVVEYPWKQELYVCDPSEGGVSTALPEGTGLQEGLEDFHCGGKHVRKPLYEFNSQEYSEFD
jgi:hypothetical protein